MPGRDGMGPAGNGRGTGRGSRGCRFNATIGGRGRMQGNNAGAGPGGNCICPSCGRKVPHQPGMPCYNTVCPDCGAKMARE